MRTLLAALLTASLATGAGAEDKLSDLADRLLWCGSAMYWLSVDAYDAGENEDGDQYDAWSTNLADRATLMLEAEGRDEAAIAALRDDYDARVVGEMGKPGAKYDVTTCPDLAAQ